MGVGSRVVVASSNFVGSGFARFDVGDGDTYNLALIGVEVCGVVSSWFFHTYQAQPAAPCAVMDSSIARAMVIFPAITRPSHITPVVTGVTN